MNEKLRESVRDYIYLLMPIFDQNVDIESLVEEVYVKLLNKNNRNIYVNQRYLSDSIINLFINEEVKTSFNEDFRYAYIYVADRVEDTFVKSNQYNKSKEDVEELSFKIIVSALLNNINMKEFNTLRLDGYIDQYATMDIVRMNSTIRNNQRIEEEIKEENRRANIEKKVKLKQDVVKMIIAMGIILGLIITSNIIINTFRAIIKGLSKENPDPSKLSDMKSIENTLHELGYYDYENNEFIRS